MQEVFEKIITKLGNRAEKSENDDSRMYKGERIAFGDAIEKIIKQAAAEYNDGWIPCRERLPEKYNRVLVCTDKGNYYTAHLNKEQKWVCTSDSTMIVNSNIIAWQPLPAIYQPKGESI